MSENKTAKTPTDGGFEYWNAVEGWVKIDEVREHFDAVGCGTIYKSAGEGRTPLYTTPPKQWVGLTDDEAALAQQEPVAWLSTDCIGERYLCFTKPKDNDPVQPLYTTPPKAAEWVGLTDDEIQDLSYLSQKIDASNSAWFDRWEFARAIEAKLKEKNT